MNMLEQVIKNGETYVKNAADGNKKLMRMRCKEIAEAMEQSYVARASEEIASRVLASEEYRTAQTVFCYLHFGKEPATDAIIAQALADGKRVCVPLCTGPHDMEAKRYREGDLLQPGAFGIPEPSAEAETIPREAIELAIVPCLACDRDGKRIGHGAGYYDRYLADTTCVKMALCFEKLIMCNVPWYKTDVGMDLVETDENTYGRRWRESMGTAQILPLR